MLAWVSQEVKIGWMLGRHWHYLEHQVHAQRGSQGSRGMSVGLCSHQRWWPEATSAQRTTAGRSNMVRGERTLVLQALPRVQEQIHGHCQLVCAIAHLGDGHWNYS